MLDLTEPTATRSRRGSASLAAPSPSTFLSAVSSIASPTGVPVPCPSTIVTVAGSTPAFSYARRSASSWSGLRGGRAGGRQAGEAGKGAPEDAGPLVWEQAVRGFGGE